MTHTRAATRTVSRFAALTAVLAAGEIGRAHV